MKIFSSAFTDVGRVRKENQDSYGLMPEKGFFFVCDGMGGGAAGDFASRAAVALIMKAMEKLTDSDIDAIVGGSAPSLERRLCYPIAAMRLGNRLLSNLARKHQRLAGMGTTIVAGYFDEARSVMHIYHVGDSRLYRFRNGRLELLTKDHSKVNELIDQGKMSEDEVKTAEIQSMITRALGTNPRVKIDYRKEGLQPGDMFILCTDGLNGEIEDDRIQGIIIENRANLNGIPRLLVDEANAAGGRDNTTVVALEVLKQSADETVLEEYRRGTVITVEEETLVQSRAEDRLLKTFQKQANIQIPKGAQENAVIGNPIFLGVLLCGILIAGAGFILPRLTVEKHEAKLVDLAGKVAGVTVEVRVPLEAQVAGFRKTEDSIQKLQMIQDWYKDSATYTVPLKNVEIIIEKDGKESFRGLTEGGSTTAAVGQGRYQLHLHCANYRIINEKMETPEFVPIVVELSAKPRSETIIMLPEE